MIHEPMINYDVEGISSRSTVRKDSRNTIVRGFLHVFSCGGNESCVSMFQAASARTSIGRSILVLADKIKIRGSFLHTVGLIERISLDLPAPNHVWAVNQPLDIV